jgi:hypothetical protein
MRGLSSGESHLVYSVIDRLVHVWLVQASCVIRATWYKILKICFELDWDLEASSIKHSCTSYIKKREIEKKKIKTRKPMLV